MTFAEIKELHSMGFTPEQITMLTTSAPSQGADNSPVGDNPSPTDAPDRPEEAPVPVDSSSMGEEIPSSSPVPEEHSAPEESEMLKSLRAEIADLKKMVQSNNIRDRTYTPSPVPEVPEVSAEDILAQLIRPELPHKEV